MTPKGETVSFVAFAIQERASDMILVCWATGERFTYRLPNLSLITLSPPVRNSEVLGLLMGPYVPSPQFSTTSRGPARVFDQILDERKFCFL